MVLPSSVVQPIPFLPGLIADGNSGDWNESYVPLKILSDICGHVPDSNDFQALFRFAWNEKGLYILAEIVDDSLYEDPDRFWKGDGLELFLSPGRGSPDILQISVRPGFDQPDSLAAFIINYHHRSVIIDEAETSITFYGDKSSQGYTLEGLVPLDMIGI